MFRYPSLVLSFTIIFLSRPLWNGVGYFKNKLLWWPDNWKVSSISCETGHSAWQNIRFQSILLKLAVSELSGLLDDSMFFISPVTRELWRVGNIVSVQVRVLWACCVKSVQRMAFVKLKSYFSSWVKNNWCRTISSEIFCWNTLPNFEYVSVNSTWKQTCFLNMKRMAVDDLFFSHLYFYILQDYHENKYRTPWT